MRGWWSWRGRLVEAGNVNLIFTLHYPLAFLEKFARYELMIFMLAERCIVGVKASEGVVGWCWLF